MGLLDFPRVDEPERIDDPGGSLDFIGASLDNLARTNRLFGGTSAVIRGVSRLLQDVPRGTVVRILDVATGSADIPRALAEWGRKRCLDLQIVAVDNHPAMLRSARRGPDAPLLVRADALALPFAPASFDIVICALAFHHLGWDASLRVLRGMDSLATRGFVVSDLRRDWPSLLGVRAALALIGADPITRHDGPASVRRAWNVGEYRRMAAESGVLGISIAAPWYFRVTVVQDKRTIQCATLTPCTNAPIATS